MNNSYTDVFDPLNGLKQVVPVQVRKDLRVTVMKGYSLHPKSSEVEPHHQM